MCYIETMKHTLTLHQSLDIFSDSLEDIKQACIENIDDIVSNTKKGNFGWVSEEVLKLKIEYHTRHYRKSLKAIVSRQQVSLNPLQALSKITDEQIERAKEYPIQELYESLTGNTIRGGMAKCPFHDDKTASFSMRRYNRYRCFGCEEKGSVIDLHMKLNNSTFTKSVRALL